MWVYIVHKGELSHNGEFVGTGYSGLQGNCRNNPTTETFQDAGPIPRGKYKIGAAYLHPHLGPCVMNLDPLPETNTFGRSLFRIHGDNKTGNASHGCVILGPSIRKEIALSADRILQVM